MSSKVLVLACDQVGLPCDSSLNLTPTHLSPSLFRVWILKKAYLNKMHLLTKILGYSPREWDTHAVIVMLIVCSTFCFYMVLLMSNASFLILPSKSIFSYNDPAQSHWNPDSNIIIDQWISLNGLNRLSQIIMMSLNINTCYKIQNILCPWI